MYLVLKLKVYGQRVVSMPGVEVEGLAKVHTVIGYNAVAIIDRWEQLINFMAKPPLFLPNGKGHAPYLNFSCVLASPPQFFGHSFYFTDPTSLGALPDSEYQSSPVAVSIM